VIDTSEIKGKIYKTEGLIMKAEQDLFYLRPYLEELKSDLANMERVNSRNTN